MRSMMMAVVAMVVGCADADGEPIADVECKVVECHGATQEHEGERRGQWAHYCWWSCDDADAERTATWERVDGECYSLAEVTIDAC